MQVKKQKGRAARSGDGGAARARARTVDGGAVVKVRYATSTLLCH